MWKHFRGPRARKFREHNGEVTGRPQRAYNRHRHGMMSVLHLIRFACASLTTSAVKGGKGALRRAIALEEWLEAWTKVRVALHSKFTFNQRPSSKLWHNAPAHGGRTDSTAPAVVGLPSGSRTASARAARREYPEQPDLSLWDRRSIESTNAPEDEERICKIRFRSSTLTA